MTDLLPSIRYKISKSINAEDSYRDPQDWIVQIEAEIFVLSEDNYETYAGKCNFYFVDIETCCALSDYDPSSLLDIESPTSFFIDLFDETNYFSEEVKQVLQTEPHLRNLFIIDRVEIIHKFRGKGLSELAILDAINLHGMQAQVVALKSYPLQMEASYPRLEPSVHNKLMALDTFTCSNEDATHKLGLFYEKLGFKFIGNEGIMIKSR